ncbi:MAG: TlpA disulfide reductase family protein [Candidatus Competibacterales bacterium]
MFLRRLLAVTAGLAAAALCVALGVIAAHTVVSTSTAESPPKTSAEALTATPQPVPAPPLETTTVEGETFELVAYLGRGVVINFWATWCAPCIEEMPDLDRAAAALAPDDVVVVGVNVGETPSTIARFLERHPVDFPILLDPEGTIGDRWQLIGMPTTFLVNTQGQVEEVITGIRPWDEPEMLARLRRLGE